MKTIRPSLILAASLAAALALAGCGKNDDPASQIPANSPPEASAPAAPPTTMAPASATTAGMAMGDTGALSLSSVQLGSSVDADNRIAASGDSFAPKDSIYASVDTVGGSGTVSAKWTYQDGQTVREDSKKLNDGGPQTTVFMISKPSGFPAGDYKVEISLDGEQAASKDFSVR